MAAPPPLALVAILPDGGTAEQVADLAAVPADVVPSAVALYAERGYEPPFVGYLAIAAGRAVGTWGFPAPPRDGRVEIAYFTFPGAEGRGVATAMARRLVALAGAARPQLTVFAHTRPGPGASVTVLSRLGFGCAGVVDHPEDGPLWEWCLPPTPAGLPGGPPAL